MMCVMCVFVRCECAMSVVYLSGCDVYDMM